MKSNNVYRKGDLTMENKKKSYLSMFFKSGYFLYALLFTCLACTGVVLAYSSGLIGAIMSNKDVRLFATLIAIVVSLVGLIWIIGSCKKSKIAMTDSVSWAILLTTIFFIIYNAVEVGTFGAKKIIVVVLGLLVGLIFVILNAKKLNPELDDQKPIKNSLRCYYKTIFKKYSFFAIACATVVCSAVALLAFSTSLLTGFSKKELICAGICLLPALVFIASSLSSKKVGVIDALILALTFTAPIALLIVILSDLAQERNLILWAFAFAMLIFFTFMRYRSFNLEANEPECEIEKCCPACYYLKSVSKKHGITLAIAIGALLAGSLFIIFPISSLTSLIKVKDGISFNPLFLVVGVIQFTVLATLLVSVLLSVVNLSSKKVNVADFLLIAFASFAFFGLIDVAVAFNVKKLLILALAFFFALSLIIARARKVFEN